jgi:hypothetical protein
MRTFLYVSCCSLLFAANASLAREFHVATNGSDAAGGGAADPFLTINRAAAVAQPGDIVTVHAGTYREWVKPPRGGTGEEARIVYRAAPSETVAIKGSERITNWVGEANGVWKAEVPNTLFGDYNPFALNLSGRWLHYGAEHHRGDVYLNGEAFYETKTPEEVAARKGTWHAQMEGNKTVIRAHFGNTNPNLELTEINVRESVFMPTLTGLSYITVEGFHLEHSAENWQPPSLELQSGMISPRGGKHWIIQRCRITNARCVGIMLGLAPGVDYNDIETFGDHVVRGNWIRRCGQAGIAGMNGATRCLIEGNLIEDINYRKEFGGFETAGIKFHNSVDTTIRSNLIRRVRHQRSGAYGIWIDWANQGTRITGNIILDTDTENLFLEMNHGAILVDNNVLARGRGIRSNSEGSVFAHNLFVDCAWDFKQDLKRQSQYFKPHTRIEVARKPGIPRDNKWFNNIFIRRGLEKVKEAAGNVSGYNVFLEGAEPSVFGDTNSVGEAASSLFKIQEDARGVTITYALPASALDMPNPWVDTKLTGVFPTLGQGLEDRFGQPIRVDVDYAGYKRELPKLGPLANPSRDSNIIVWKLGE